MRRSLGWAMLSLFAILVIFTLGGIILHLLDRRYRDLTVFIALGIATLLCFMTPFYLATRTTHLLWEILQRAVPSLLLTIAIWTFCCCMFFFCYNAESYNDGWFAPTDKIVYNDGFLAHMHIVVYDPQNVLWTGSRLPEYEYID